MAEPDFSSADAYVIYNRASDLPRHQQYETTLQICARVCDVSTDVMQNAVCQLERKLRQIANGSASANANANTQADDQSVQGEAGEANEEEEEDEGIEEERKEEEELVANSSDSK